MLQYVNFSSEGEPHDRGLDLRGAAREVAQIVSNSPAPICAHFYTPRKLVSEFGDGAAWTVRAHDDSRRIAKGYNQGYHRVGMGAWRIFLIHQVLLKSQPGDMVFFHDGNLNKYPEIRFVIQNMHTYAKMISDLWEGSSTPRESRIFSPLHLSNHVITKSEVFDFMTEDSAGNGVNLEEFARAPAGRARLIAVENNERTISFFAELSELCLTRNELLLSSEGKDRGFFANQPFSHHCAEQALFNAYAWKRGVFHSELPLFKIGAVVGNKDWGHGNDSGFRNLARYLELKKLYLEFKCKI